MTLLRLNRTIGPPLAALVAGFLITTMLPHLPRFPVDAWDAAFVAFKAIVMMALGVYLGETWPVENVAQSEEARTTAFLTLLAALVGTAAGLMIVLG